MKQLFGKVMVAMVLLLLVGCTTGPEVASERGKDVPPTATSIPTPIPTSIPSAPPIVPPQINMPSTIPLALILLAIFGMGTFVVIALVVMNFVSKLLRKDSKKAKPQTEELFGTIGPREIESRLRQLEKTNNAVPEQLDDLETKGQLLVNAIHDMMELTKGLNELVQMYRDALQAIKGESMDYDALAELVGEFTKRDKITATRLEKPWLWNEDFRRKMIFNLHALAGSLSQAIDEQWQQVNRLDQIVQQYTVQEHDLWTQKEISRTEAPSLQFTKALRTIRTTLASARKTLIEHRNRRERVAQGQQARFLPTRQSPVIDLPIPENSKVIEMSDL